MSRILAFEWRRAVSLRSTWVFLVLGIVLLVLIGWAAMIFGEPQDAGAEAGMPSLERVAAFDGGSPLGLILVTTICAQAFGHEYRDGTMRLVLSQFPRRPRVFLAKLGVPIGFVTASLLLALALALAGAAVLFEVAPEGTWGGVALIASRQVLLAIWWGLIVAGVTALFRNLAGGLVVSLVFAFVLEGLTIALLSKEDPATGDVTSRAPWLTENLPFTNALVWASEGAGRAGVVAAIWVMGVVGLALTLFLRRDA